MRVDRNEIEKLQKIGKGGCSHVYRDGDIAYKILKDEAKRAYSRYYNKEALQKFVNLDSDLCIYPIEVLEDENGELQGYAMNYEPVVNLYKIIRELPFEQLEGAIKEAENKMEKESKNKVIFNDMHSDNIMWNTEKKSIQISDADFFIEDTEKTEKEIYSRNSVRFVNGIKDMISYDFYDYIHDNEEIHKLEHEFANKQKEKQPISANDYISKVRNILETEFETTFNSIGEMVEAVRVRKEEIEDQEYERRIMQEEAKKNMPLKQKIAIKMSNTFLRKVPFIKTFIEKQMKMLPEVLKSDSLEDTYNDDSRKKFEDELSNNGEYRKKDLKRAKNMQQNSNSEQQNSTQTFISGGMQK